MRIVNVIVTRNGIVNEIESFGIVDEQLSDEVIEQAEETFMEKIVSICHEDTTSEEADWTREEVLENWIDGGYYEVGDDVNTVVHLAWSDIENIQN
jgi:hypothetical protein